jgi:hypothetical protein
MENTIIQYASAFLGTLLFVVIAKVVVTYLLNNFNSYRKS